jgi:NAD(P)-dependent dehydrogenase (short-subunit alcohol dehydrogenase family)
MDMELEGKVAVVTGGSKGIGLAVVRSLRDEGVRVVVASRSRGEGLEEVLGEDVVHVAVDLMAADAAAEVVARAVETFGGVDLLVNNAGGPPPGDALPHGGFLGRTDAHWTDMYVFNVLSAVRACRASIPVMLERGGGAIVNVSSGNGFAPVPINLDYAACKAALINLTKALSEEFAPQGIRVNGVAPGPTVTPWWTEPGGAADLIAEMTGTERDGVMATLAPEMMQLTTGRFATPEEVADAVTFLLSPRCASTTGAELAVDSGFLKSI